MIREKNADAISRKVRGVMARYGRVLDADIDSDWYLMKLQEELSDMTEKYLDMTGRSRRPSAKKRQAKKEFADEMSDVLCLTLLLADRCKVKLDSAVQGQWHAFAK